MHNCNTRYFKYTAYETKDITDGFFHSFDKNCRHHNSAKLAQRESFARKKILMHEQCMKYCPCPPPPSPTPSQLGTIYYAKCICFVQFIAWFEHYIQRFVLISREKELISNGNFSTKSIDCMFCDHEDQVKIFRFSQWEWIKMKNL